MSKVNILPEEIISKIAAGEVIERPASVVKELLENSLDAGANTIELELKDAGKTLIRIKDNGSGIAKEDITKIFLRHATSKISTADDLFAINSLGFRGEALYSIAAIADVVLRSKSQDKNNENGWEIHIQGSKQLKFRPCGFNHFGTEIEIKELFFNTPARKKFLKSNTTEINQILNIFIPYTLLNKNIRFQLTHQRKILLDLSPSDKIIERISDALNIESKHLIETEKFFHDQNISAKMILGDINISRTRRDMQFIFVNGRPVASKQISYQLNNVYRLILPSASFGFFAVFLEIPPQDVDVNIHPAKREVKIKDEAKISSFLRHMCEDALMTKGTIKQTGDFTKQSPEKNTTPPYKIPTYNNVQISETGEGIGEQKSDTPVARNREPLYFTKKKADTDYNPLITKNEQNDFFSNAAEKLLEQKNNTLHDQLTSSRYIGSFVNKYLLFETSDSLLLVDQHAAAERITFEAMIAQIQKGKVEVQHLLMPFLIKLTPQELNAWEESRENLEIFGFESTQFDEETVAIHAYPTLLKNPEKGAQEILSGGELTNYDYETLARRACRASIMTGDRLANSEVEHLRAQLLNCLDPFTCPHGRPTVIELKESFLSKQFLRT